MLSPKLVIFDLDGTLIDSVPDLARAVDATLKQLNLPTVGEARVRPWVGNGAAKLIERAMAFVNSRQLQQHALEQFFIHYERYCADKTALYPGVAETLGRLNDRSVTMAIATNKPRRFIQPILKHLEIESYFRCVVGGDDLPDKKPNPSQLHWCLDYLGFSGVEALMVGDSRNDIQAAKSVPMPVAAVNYGYNHGRSIEEEGADWVIANFAELLDIIDNTRLQSRY